MTVQDPPQAFTGQLPPPAAPARKPGRSLVRPLLAVLFGAPALVLLAAAALVWTRYDDPALAAEAAQARTRVVAIVNQPVTPLPRRTVAREYSPGWFHEGALRPDFNKVDVRATQEFPYASQTYVTSDLNPAVMFRGRDLEFNAMTKFFYVDRTLPKKRLSEDQMEEINRLYRVMGRAEQVSARRAGIAGALLGSAFFMLLALGFQLRRPRPA